MQGQTCTLYEPSGSKCDSFFANKLIYLPSGNSTQALIEATQVAPKVAGLGAFVPQICRSLGIQLICASSYLTCDIVNGSFGNAIDCNAVSFLFLIPLFLFLYSGCAFPLSGSLRVNGAGVQSHLLDYRRGVPAATLLSHCVSHNQLRQHHLLSRYLSLLLSFPHSPSLFDSFLVQNQTVVIDHNQKPLAIQSD